MRRLKQLLKNRGIKLALEGFVILLVFLTVKTYTQRDLAQGPAPTVQNTLLNGQPVNLQSYRGQTVLLHFWATWCSICKLEQSGIDAISKDHPVITIAMNSGNAEQITAYLTENNLTFPVIVDEYGTIAQRFGVRGVPTSFIIDPKGVIAFTDIGYTTTWGLRLRLLLAAN